MDGLKRGWRASRSESGLHGGQPAKKPPGQAGVVGENDALSLGNHLIYIATYTSLDNDGRAQAKRQSTISTSSLAVPAFSLFAKSRASFRVNEPAI
jgi:hypothetical protein